MGWIDVAAGISAKRHACTPSVTRSVDDVAFLHPVHVGDIVTIQASVNKSWNTSMEVGVKVEAETPVTGERFFVAHAYLTFVALSPRPRPRTYLGSIFTDYAPVRVPALIPHSPMEKQRFDMAEQRRQARFKEPRKQLGLQAMRDRMRDWSQGLRERAQEHAEIKPYPGLQAVMPGETTLSGEPQPRQRRYSADPRMMLKIREKPMESTFAEVVELVMPQHANTLSITFGGQIMAWMEACALASANRIAHAYLLTASIDSLQFITPTKVGDVVTVRSIVSHTYTSSLEVYVCVEAENLQTGKVEFTNDGFFTIAAIDDEHLPVKVPKAIPQSEAEMELHRNGSARRKKRLAQRLELINLVTSPESETVQSPASL
ncbi:HotDog domain-containing protein [Syncephalastrum racemosum]|uniref:HotDog domain-containing protein n=1 Tax=Syncephalastrum racemosum TaxID=13706 RepID=A0A1X2H8W2_SYNRA|nr:HotDog domain-containing protein [Syncephalastrum racemosum]